MTFSCPHKDENSTHCQKLNEICVPGRPGCVQEHTAHFTEDIETRIKRAESIYHKQKSKKRR